MQWMILPFRRYADFAGRSRRKEYWMFQLLNALVVVIAMFIAAATDPGPDAFGQAQGPSTIGSIVFILLGLYVLAAFIPWIAVEVRRYHDQGKPGYYWFWRLFPGIGGLIVLYFMCQRGTYGENEYGEDPLNPGVSGVFD